MNSRLLFPLILLSMGCLPGRAAQPVAEVKLPFITAGLTERQAAVHLLNRFTFGPRPGDVNKVVAMGLEVWLEHQLAADLPEPVLSPLLDSLPALHLTGREIMKLYPRPGIVRGLAIRNGVLSRDSLASMDEEVIRERLQAYRLSSGFKPERDLMRQLVSQKILSARYGENQLAEVLTDFWFNHFNVALSKGRVRTHLLSYEREAIRPHVLGHFRDLLGATAHHPAMLLYLDNAQSRASDTIRTTMDVRMDQFAQIGGAGVRARTAKRQAQIHQMQNQPARLRQGINENYARELMELHTLGVDGGYSQADVVAVARAFTGWTFAPATPDGEEMLSRLRKRKAAGFYVDGSFVFRANEHDATEKTILGVRFPAGGGLDEGERVLDMLASNSATAHHLARQLAVRFVSDDPPNALIDELASVYQESDGNIASVLRALAYSSYFWDSESRYAKIKSPFELAESAIRGLDADVREVRPLTDAIGQMGQPLYNYAAPTGYPDRGSSWINAGTLISRINFAFRLAIGRVRGIHINLVGLNGNRKPASVEDALDKYTHILLPEREVSRVVERLRPLVNDPSLMQNIQVRAGEYQTETMVRKSATTLGRVVGVILSSPAFQRR